MQLQQKWARVKISKRLGSLKGEQGYYSRFWSYRSMYRQISQTLRLHNYRN